MPLTWLVLAWPSWPLVKEVFLNERYYAEIMYDSGLLAVQFTVLALVITPFMNLVRSWPTGVQIMRWIFRRRRAIGIAAFGYGALHTFYYVRYTGSLELIILNLVEWDLLTGWIAFLIFLVLAVISNKKSVRFLGRNWKPLQRAAYFAAGFTALHWYLIGQFETLLMQWFLPVLLLQLLRLIPSKRTQNSA